MSKVILVMDKPDFCSECILCKTTKANDIWEFEEKRCSFTNYNVKHSRPDQQLTCPLKELPKKKCFQKSRRDYHAGWTCGWNMCLAKIIGE